MSAPTTPEQSSTVVIALALAQANMALQAYQDELARGKFPPAVATSLRATIAALKRATECLALAVAASVGYAGPMTPTPPAKEPK